MVNFFIVSFFHGFSNLRSLVVAADEAEARELFLRTHPSTRDYNIRSIQPTKRRVYQLAGK